MAEVEPGPGRGPIDRLSRRVGELVSYTFLACMLIIAYEVVARYGFNAPTIWAHDTTTALCAVGFLISGVYTLQRRQHIRITFVYDKLPASARRWLDIINGAIIVAFLALLTYEGVGQATKSIRIMETAGTASQLPLPPIVKTALAVAAGLMMLQATVHLWRAVRGRAAPGSDEDAR